jgi:hypothetical protein
MGGHILLCIGFVAKDFKPNPGIRRSAIWPEISPWWLSLEEAAPYP